ncbi:MAG: hypothetical protein JWR88_2259, partial [Pseudonocardia sp.]|nr:hypothetical protein [Pseudonocardia sp.]
MLVHASELLAGYPKKLIIDLSEVSVLGSPGLAVLMRAKRTASQQDTSLVLSGTDRSAV